MTRPIRLVLAATAMLLAAACESGSDSTSDVGAAPAAPTGVVATPQSSSQVLLTWAPSTDNSLSYIVYRNEREIARTGALQFLDDGLFAATSFRYQVGAVDGTGNTSALSAAVEATTLPFAVNDVAVGDPDVNYFNVEFTADGRYQGDVNLRLPRRRSARAGARIRHHRYQSRGGCGH